MWLIKCLKVEDVAAPLQHAADSGLPVGDGVLGACDGGSVVGPVVGWPAGLAIPEHRGGSRAGDRLDVFVCLLDVVEVGGGSVADFLALPVRECVD